MSEAKESTSIVATKGTIADKPPAAPPLRLTHSNVPMTTETPPASVKAKATKTGKGNGKRNAKMGQKIKQQPPANPTNMAAQEL
jgi:hypothetical protein